MTKEQAIELAKLAVMELPKPIQRDDTEHGVDYYTADQLAAAVLAARDAALEEAAIEFDGETTQSGEDIAAAIRNMKEPNV